LECEQQDVGLIVRVISFQVFQPMWSRSTNVTDRRTDGQTDDMRSQDCTIVDRAVKTVHSLANVV